MVHIGSLRSTTARSRYTTVPEVRQGDTRSDGADH